MCIRDRTRAAGKYFGRQLAALLCGAISPLSNKRSLSSLGRLVLAWQPLRMEFPIAVPASADFAKSFDFLTQKVSKTSASGVESLKLVVQKFMMTKEAGDRQCQTRRSGNLTKSCVKIGGSLSTSSLVSFLTFRNPPFRGL